MIETIEQRRRRRELVIIFCTLVAVALITYVVVSLSGFTGEISLGNTILFFALFNVDVVLILLIIFLIVRNVVKLLFERRRGVFGSRLRSKLVAAFVGLTLVPSTILFIVAFIFINYSLEGWFTPRVEGIFDISKEIVQSRYEDDGEENLHFAKVVAKDVKQFDLLDPADYDALQNYLEEKVEEYKLTQIEIYSDRPGGLFFSTNPGFPIQKAYASPELVATGLDGKEGYIIDRADEFDVIRGVAPIISDSSDKKVIGAVVVNSFTDKSLFGQLKSNKQAYDDYRALKILKNQVRGVHIIVLVVITLLVFFSAVWFGFYMAKEITVPIQHLASGTKEVAAGNLDTVIEVESSDEIGELVKSFNRMTNDLAVSNQALDMALTDLRSKNLELDQRRQYMEIVLRNVDAGVVSLDRDGRISTINKAAQKMLNIRYEDIVGKSYFEVLPEGYVETFEETLKMVKANRDQAVKEQIRVSVRGEGLVILVTVTSLQDDAGNDHGVVMVFENLTELVRAQKAEAWREVARRIAHEIKNPLTPIQLSAQRLRKRYMNQLSGNGEVFDECTRTIVKQVEELKTLVNEFSSFAKLPSSNPAPNDLNAIIREVVSLYQGAHNNIDFEYVEEERLPIFELDRDQIKRVFINLIDNAVDAIGRENGKIKIETMYNENLEIARVEISDTGKGIRPEDKARIFDPYFSTKKDGTGLGLVIVNRIIQDHYGYIRIKGLVPKGTQFIVELPIQLPYRAIQEKMARTADRGQMSVGEETEEIIKEKHS